MAGSGLFTKMKAAIEHLVRPGGGLGGELHDLRKDVANTFLPMVALTKDVYVNPVAAAAAGLEAATATTVAPRTVTSFLAGGVAALAAYPRNVTFTTAGGTPADAPATATITGTYRGKAQTEVVNIAQTATIATGLKPFSTITSIAYSAAEGTGATVSIGVGLGVGTSMVPVTNTTAGSAILLLADAVDGVVNLTGALNTHGLYTPATAANGVHDYVIWYEYDPNV